MDVLTLAYSATIAAAEAASSDELGFFASMAKKYEAARPEFAPEGIRDVDAVLSTTEFLEMIEMLRLTPQDIEPGEFDAPYSKVSGAGVLFGASGGVAEGSGSVSRHSRTATAR